MGLAKQIKNYAQDDFPSRLKEDLDALILVIFK